MSSGGSYHSQSGAREGLVAPVGERLADLGITVTDPQVVRRQRLPTQMQLSALRG